MWSGGDELMPIARTLNRAFEQSLDRNIGLRPDTPNLGQTLDICRSSFKEVGGTETRGRGNTTLWLRKHEATRLTDTDDDFLHALSHIRFQLEKVFVEKVTM